MEILAAGRWPEHTEVLRTKDMGKALTTPAEVYLLSARGLGWAHSLLAPEAKPGKDLVILTTAGEGHRRLTVY